MRELAAEETNLLRPCLEALAAHHNQTSRFFKGTYPSAPYEKTLAAFARADVREVEVKVADGNDALSFYERYGFRMNAHILRRSESTRGESSGAEE